MIPLLLSTGLAWAGWNIEGTVDAWAGPRPPHGPGVSILAERPVGGGWSVGGWTGARQHGGFDMLNLRVELAPAVGWTLGARRDWRLQAGNYLVVGATLAAISGEVSYPAVGVHEAYRAVGVKPAAYDMLSLRYRVADAWFVSAGLSVPLFDLQRQAIDGEGRVFGLGLFWSGHAT